MLGLITDRSQQNVYYRNALSQKGWSGMTNAERAEWLGDPLLATGTNLFPCGPFYSSAVELKYRNEEIVANAIWEGIYLYAVSIIGKASDYENKILTFSTDSIVASGTGTPQLALYWHDDFGFEYAGGTLLTEGSVTINTTEWPNTNSRAYLAVYVYVTTYGEIGAGEVATFRHVMLENGDTRHEYVPYTEILATRATKGAYNYSDLNRVERAVEEISDRAGLNLTTKTNWTMWDIPKVDDMSRYLGNIATIRNHFAIQTGIPASMNNLTYEGANNIELILSEAYKSLTE